MNQVITIDPVNDSRWDRFVEHHPYGWICHLSGWKIILEESFKHMKGHYLALIDERTNSILAALPVFEVKSWLTGNRLVSIPFATLSDPLVLEEAHMEQLLSETIALSEQLKSAYIEIRTLYASFDILKERLGGDYYYKHHYLEVDKDPEELKRSFHYKAVKYEINKANRSGLKLKIAKTEADLRAFYDLYIATRKRLGLPPHPYPFLEILWNTFFPLDMIELLFAEYNGKIVGGQLYFKFKERISMEYEVWDRNMKSASPNHFLIWEAIKMAHERGYKFFDFGRTSPDNVSLMDFKRRWGTKIVDLPQFRYPKEAHQAKTYYHDTSLAHRMLSFLFKRTPVFGLRLMGNFLYHHLG